jgi:hypothetical protein
MRSLSTAGGMPGKIFSSFLHRINIVQRDIKCIPRYEKNHHKILCIEFEFKEGRNE